MKERGREKYSRVKLYSQLYFWLYLCCLKYFDEKYHHYIFKIFEVAQLYPEELLYNINIFLCLAKTLHVRYIR